MFAAFILNFTIAFANGLTLQEIFEFIRNVVLNILLLQSWYPDAGVNISLNGVAWFLSSMFFLYFMFLPIRRWLRREHSRTFLIITCFVVLAIQLILSAVVVAVDDSWSFYRWVAYDAPFFRLGDFYIGCVAGTLYVSESEQKNTWRVNITQNTLFETLIVTICGVVVYWDQMEHTSFIGQVLNNYTTIYIPLAVVLIFLFVRKKGVLTRILDNRVLRKIGHDSSYYFLIHYIVCKYVLTICLYFRWNKYRGYKIVITIIIFGLTILAVQIYKGIEGKIRRKLSSMSTIKKRSPHFSGD